MPDHAERPLLFLDVDGQRSCPIAERGPPLHQGLEKWQDVSNPQLGKIDLGHGPRLLALPCVLMWATAWMDSANEVMAPLLGLPELPVADLPEAPEVDEVGVLNWKTQALVRAAAGRPFIRVDDSITELDQAWVSNAPSRHALLHRVDSTIGLIDTDCAVIDDWLLDRRTPAQQREHGHRETSRDGTGSALRVVVRYQPDGYVYLVPAARAGATASKPARHTTPADPTRVSCTPDGDERRRTRRCSTWDALWWMRRAPGYPAACAAPGPPGFSSWAPPTTWLRIKPFGLPSP